MRMLRALLLDWPARLFTLWWRLYCLVLAVVFMVVGTITALMLALFALGIRWGW